MYVSWHFATAIVIMPATSIGCYRAFVY